MLIALERRLLADGEFVPVYKMLQERIEDGWIPVEEDDIDSFI